MSIARSHNEWLSLVPTSGPFLSLETLLRVFPQGLPAHDPEGMRFLRLAWEEWEAEGQKRKSDPAIHTAWVRWVLTSLLGLPEPFLAEGQRIPEAIKAVKAEYDVTLRPSLAVMSMADANDELSFDLEEAAPKDAPLSAPLLLIQTYERGQGLDKPFKNGDAWAATPETRMQELLAQSGVKLGLITNGEDWTLVQRVTETTGYAQFSAPLWMEEPVTLRAFRAVFGPERFFGKPSETLLQLLTDSAGDYQEVTDQLGYQVRHAVELLVQALDEIDRNRGGELLAGVAEGVLYEGALTLMMRLVFLLCAEERGMFPVEEEIYGGNYAISTLMASLRAAADSHGEEILERRCDAWSRLQATFRAIWNGVNHEAMRLPAYGGNLLDPSRFCWMDGVVPLPIHNRTVLHLLESLQILRVKLPGGGPPETRRLSFRALDVEQIGHVYEGLLDHTAVRAAQPVLGLVGTKEREPEIPLAELERLRQKSSKDLLVFLKEETGRSDKALQAALDKPVSDEGQLYAACEGDADLLARVRPFAFLIRRDDFDRYVVIPAGHVYVTAGTDRRASGTHYTPRFLAERLCKRTLDPLVYYRVSEGIVPSLDTLKSPREILDLRVCDPTVGSGAFLVAGCRYLADRLCEAWEILENKNPDAILVSPEGDMSDAVPNERLIPDRTQADERRTLALRLIAEKCLYGVDKNSMAVEIAKLALWLVTMNKGKPFHFLDHAIKVGDSLLGCHKLEQLQTWSMEGKGDPHALDLFSDRLLDDLRQRRHALIAIPSDTPEQMAHKTRLYAEFEEKATRARLMADLIVAPELTKAKPKDRDKKRKEFQNWFVALPNEMQDAALRGEADKLLAGNHPFHWPLEFIDVYLREKSGFDAMMGNPPFMGGKKITGEFGDSYRDYLVNWLGRGKKGHADLVAYFFLRAVLLLREGGCVGLIATNTLAQGDTREVGLEQIIGAGYGIYAADSSFPWPGKAALEVAVVHIIAGEWSAAYRTLNDLPTAQITAFLDDGAASGKPYRLAANAGKSFNGSYVLGMGFVLETEQALALIAKDPKNTDVLFPFLNGEDLNSRPDQSPSRWVINFKDWPLGRIGQTLPVSSETLQHVAETIQINLSDEWRPKAGSRWKDAGDERREKWQRIGVVPSDYPASVAADYPDCLAIVEELVRPERAKVNDKTGRDIWWRFLRTRPELHAAITELSRVIVVAGTSRTLAYSVAKPGIVFSHATYILALGEWNHFCLVHSTLCDAWTRMYAGSLKGDLRYSPSDCFETFPFPLPDEGKRTELDNIGEAYHTHRQEVCRARDIGLTKVYNLFHDPHSTDSGITHLRDLHRDMDTAVAAAYGWDDLALGHDFYGEGKETRYTLHPDAKNEALRRLLALNHTRYAEEQAAAEDILPTVETEQEAVVSRLARGRDVAFDLAEGLFATQTQITFDEPEPETHGTPTATRTAFVPPLPLLAHAEVTRRTAMLSTYLVLRATAPEALAKLIAERSSAGTARRYREPQIYHRIRLAKHLYLAQEMIGLQDSDGHTFPGLEFRRNKKGPYTEHVEQAEYYAEREGWLKLGDGDRDEGEEKGDWTFTRRYEIRPGSINAVRELLALIGDAEPALDRALARLDTQNTVVSEQWTTVHKSWADLRVRDGKNPTDAEVQADVEAWKPKRVMFSPQHTKLILAELRHHGLLR